jgi:two-component system OmpR family sensor kinase
MRLSLFWKILLGFWATLALGAGGIVLTVVLQSQHRVGPEQNFVQLRAERDRAAAVALKYGGAAALNELVSTWPPEAAAGLGVKRTGSGEASVRLDEPRPPRPPGPIWPLAMEFLSGLVFSVILAAYLTRPIARLRAGFDSLARGALGTRLAPGMGRRRDEIADLARDFDAMAERLEQLVSSRDRLLHDVSHELRSPLSRMSLAIGLVRQNPKRIAEGLDRIEADGARLNAIVGDLLSLSRAEAGAPREERYFDICHLLEVICTDARFEAEPKTVAVQLFLDGTLKASEEASLAVGAPELIRRALENVIRNAIRFSPKRATVTVDARREGEGIVIEVQDRGPGIEPALATSLFEPFVKGSRDGSGAGLGLAIAQRAMTAHGGRIEAFDPPDGGTLIRIWLPQTVD